ncbi:MULTISPECIES: spore coat protein U domain-containing protein [unclassified Sphingomonas]|uniref:spore coat protein U domain-containing protein n=1 Tax=unclassified Sphingomonas TaxID=196159 RepID=UPI002269C4D6|nr:MULTISPECIES: spore coat protein U domain-containing protein [unclassified Sphingomonas]
MHRIVTPLARIALGFIIVGSRCRVGLTRRWLAPAMLLAAIVYARAATACTVSATNAALGTYSPSAVKAKVVPVTRARAGLQCSFALLNLLGGDYVRATFFSANTFKLVRDGGGGSIGYKASADEAGAYAAVQGSTVDYTQNNLLNLLGLLGSSNADLPIFIKPDDAVFPPVGVYKDTITIAWSWNICTGIGLLGACVGTPDKSIGTSVIDVTLTVTPVAAVITTSSATTWDPVNKAINPRDLPGSRRALSVTFRNPDIAPFDSPFVDVIVGTPGGTVIALDGDGTSQAAAITYADGSPASSLAVRYINPSDLGDDVDFSADGGASWSYVPVAGDLASQGAVTNVRIRARGTMAAGSSFLVRIPYLVR